MNKPTNAGHELADVIERAIAARNPAPGSVVGSEQAIRDEVGAGRAVFRQAMRILQHRGTLILRRGQGGGIVFVGKEDQATARDLARLIESRMIDPDDIWELQRAADLRIFLREGRRLRYEDGVRLRELMLSLEAMSQVEFTRELGHRKLQSMLRSILQDDLVIFAQRVVLEAGIDMFPAEWHLAGESFRREFWVQSLAFAESLIANDVAGMVAARDAQLKQMRLTFRAAYSQQELGLSRRIDMPENPSPLRRADLVVAGNRADFLVRELLDEIRMRDWREGERLGTAPELMARFGVSLPVLREATRVLEEGGVIAVSRGRTGGFEIGVPSQGTALSRAASVVRGACGKGADTMEFLVNLLLVALDQAVLRARSMEIADLKAAIDAADPVWLPGKPASQQLCTAIVGLSRNSALMTFVALILQSDAGKARPPKGVDRRGLLNEMFAAVQRRDPAMARCALLNYVGVD